MPATKKYHGGRGLLQVEVEFWRNWDGMVQMAKRQMYLVKHLALLALEVEGTPGSRGFAARCHVFFKFVPRLWKYVMDKSLQDNLQQE